MKTHRLFFALWPSQQIRKKIEQTVSPVLHPLHGRVTPVHNLHITLHYVGSSTDMMKDCMHEAAATIRFRPFQLALDHFGVFRKAGVIWMGANAIPAELESLHDNLGGALSVCGYHRDKRPYMPHLTLAKKCTDPVPEFEGLPVIWTVDDFVLVESVPCEGGVIYQVVERYAMA